MSSKYRRDWAYLGIISIQLLGMICESRPSAVAQRRPHHPLLTGQHLNLYDKAVLTRHD